MMSLPTITRTITALSAILMFVAAAPVDPSQIEVTTQAAQAAAVRSEQLALGLTWPLLLVTMIFVPLIMGYLSKRFGMFVDEVD